MRGKRVWPTVEGYLKGLNQPGDFGRVTAHMPANLLPEQWARQTWWQVIAPDGSSCRLNPKIHSVEEHDDGTITVHPSIVTTTWHGWLKRGVWEVCS